MRQTWRALVVGMILCLLSGLPSSARTPHAMLVSHSRPNAGIVAGQSEFDRLIAAELQRYFVALTGATFEIVSSEDARRRPSSPVWVLVGGPQTNDSTSEATINRRVDFDKLKADGFILRTVQLEGRHALIVGGIEDAATM